MRLHPLFAFLLTLALGASGAAEAKTPPKHPKKSSVRKKPAAPPRPRIDYSGEDVHFEEWRAMAEFKDEMVARHGFDRAELDALVRQLRFIDSAVQLVKPAPPGKPKNWQAYRARFIEPIRVNAGLRFWNENADTLARAEREYGVPAEIIVGILGVETLYGRDTGRFRVLDVLATLAFAYPDTPNRDARMAFFREELANALLFARRNHSDPLSLLGSFAGAVGMPQFMPGSILKYGIDFDGDANVDLRGSAADAIGSVANFLVQHGWNRAQPGPIAAPADVSPARQWERFIGAGLSAAFTQEELAAAGVLAGAPLPPEEQYGLVDLQNGAEPTEYWLGSTNFYAIAQYNRSFFYAMSVIELGRAVRQARG